MNNSTATIGSIIVIAILLIGGWFLFTKAPAAPQGDAAPQTVTGADEGAGTTLANPTVRYTDDGYVPSTISITEGQTVTWVNESSKQMWVASAMHPSHAVYNGTTLAEHCADRVPKTGDVFDQCTGSANGTSWTFTFDKAGTWRYHDHIDATKFGSVEVAPASASGMIGGDAVIGAEIDVR